MLTLERNLNVNSIGIGERSSRTRVAQVVRRDRQAGRAAEARSRREGHAVEGRIDVRERASERHSRVGRAVTGSGTVAITEAKAQAR